MRSRSRFARCWGDCPPTRWSLHAGSPWRAWERCAPAPPDPAAAHLRAQRERRQDGHGRTDRAGLFTLGAAPEAREPPVVPDGEAIVKRDRHLTPVGCVSVDDPADAEVLEVAAQPIMVNEPVASNRVPQSLAGAA